MNDKQVLAEFLAATEPGVKMSPPTETELENRALVKECRRLIARIKAYRKA